MRPFEGIDVLDLTQSIAGPLATQFLGTLGANVVKVEPPGGDAFRGLLDGAMFASVNLGGKRSVCLDLTTDEGRAAAHELAATADVVVQSFRPGTVEKFGLDYDSVTESNPEVVYCSLTGFGEDGPCREWPAYDPVVQAMSGLMSTIGYPDRPPVRIGASVIDYGTGTTAAMLVAAALHERERTGRGEFIDVNLFEVAVSWMGYWIAHYTGTGEVPQPSGQGFAGLAPNEVFDAARGEPFYLSVVNNRLFGRLCTAIGREDLVTDERFVENADRWENREALRDELRAEFETYDRDELTALLAEAGVPTGPLQTVDELVEDDEHVAARGMLTDTRNLRTDAPVKTANAPFKTASGRPDLGDRPPRRGEHTREVLAELGYSAEQIDRMLEAGGAAA
ncbi:CaiB/BaiF CoA transferase family protein [Halomarina halobia]|uniref:CaiB/BaiF CoA transferase family protein n=1 Tax=Halomarina halobia TaxID=3033386 RepID=A0ABD6AEN1_9EURY|nr:CaiB/BaiF CoA-transferase family protein [Halomarina sp. PSR21]